MIMKNKFLLMLITIGLASCGTIEQVTHTDIIDYSRFTKNGIFVTESNSVNFDYEPLGSVVSTSRGPSASALVSMKVDMDKAFSDIGKKLKEIDADGLINLKITNYADKYFYFTTVTGMAIRRNPIDKSVVTTYQEVLGYVDQIKLEVVEAYESGTKILTSAQMSVDQVKKAKKKFFASQNRVFFYTNDGLKANTPYMSILDSHIVDYSTNEFIPLK